MPTLGTIVLVNTEPDANNGSVTAPAVVTRDWPAVDADPANDVQAVPEHVSVRVLADNHGPVQHRAFLTAVDDLAAVDGAEDVYQLLPGSAGTPLPASAFAPGTEVPAIPSQSPDMTKAPAPAE